MADRRLRYPLLWAAFIAILIVGAALVSSKDGWVQALGLAMLAVPLIGFGVIALAYYLVERFRASKSEK